MHLATWPQVDGALVDDALAAQMRARPPPGRARARGPGRGQGPTRQPLRRALVATRRYDAALARSCAREIAEELNIGALEPLSGAGADLVDHSAKGNFRALGKRFAKDTPRVAAAIAAADAGALAAALAADGRGHGRASTASRSRCCPTR